LRSRSNIIRHHDYIIIATRTRETLRHSFRFVYYTRRRRRRCVWTGCRCGFSPIRRIVGHRIRFFPDVGIRMGIKKEEKKLKTSLDRVYFPLSRIPTTIPPLFPLYNPPVKLSDTRAGVSLVMLTCIGRVGIIQGDYF